ncbi:hypothetical protein GQ54DRAFT_303158 [Martensiomyces pterosporus]|nr:hypothetical protein GQ54DRAFT_303158 [Martensiomyces pterosporus]
MCRAHGIESVMAEYGYYHYLAKLLEFYGLLTLLVKGRRPSLFFHAYLTSSVLAAYATLAYDVPQMFVHLVVSAVDTVLQYTLLLFCWFEYEIPAVSRAAEVSQVVFPVVAAAWGAWWVLMADDKCASDAQRSIGLFVYLANLPALALQVHRIKRGTRKLRAHKGYSTYYSKE